MTSRRAALRCLWGLASAPVLAWATQAPQPEQLERGRQIYVDSTSPAGGEIVAVLGDGIEVPAAAVPCAGCHGRDGRGRPEGGLTPTDITWDRLARPYGAVAAGGRRHPPYDARSLERSLVFGVDPAGTPLHTAMPRYRMGRTDMADLVAYLQTLGRETDPGVGEASLRIGVLLPGGEAARGMAEAVRAVLVARMAAFNAAGGSYGRAIELRFLEAPAAAGEFVARLAEDLATEPLLAALAVLRSGPDGDLTALCAEQRLPLVTPFAPEPPEPPEPATAAGRYLFALLPGLDAQARGIVRLARESLGAAPPTMFVLAPEDSRLDAAVDAVQEAASGWAAVAARRYPRAGFAPAALAGELAAAPAGAILFLGSGEEAVALLEAAVPLDWRPRLYATGAAGSALLGAPVQFADRLFAALPAPPRLGSLAAARYRQLAGSGALPTAHLSAQVLALGAAEVLLEALTRAGRDVDRERLVESLESLRRFETSYLPPVTFGPGRRVGTRGVYLARIDLATRTFRPAGGWLETP